MQQKKTSFLHALSELAIYIVLFILLLAAEFGLLVATARIPKSCLQKNLKASADYLMEQPVFFHVQKEDASSQIDRYADAILLNILSCYDSAHPVTSVLRSSYYHTADANENENLYTVVNNNVSPTIDYMRYWHGSIFLLRPLFALLQVKHIYWLNAAILLLLSLLLLYRLYKCYNGRVALCFALALIPIGIWYVPYSLEYTFMFLLMLSGCLVLLSLIDRQPAGIPVFFFVIGSLTAYFDFLTTETITLLVPLVLCLLSAHQSGHIRTFMDGMRVILKQGSLWLSAYALTWCSKWLLYTLVTHENGFTDALNQAAYRIQGSTTNAPTGILLSRNAILRNLGCLFPFSYMDAYGYVAVLGILLLLLCLFYLVKTRRQTSCLVPLLSLIAVLPYLRFAILANHAYNHAFFTYRAQLTTLFCIGLIFLYGTDWQFVKKEWNKAKRSILHLFQA